jgi:hypothetical protein
VRQFERRLASIRADRRLTSAGKEGARIAAAQEAERALRAVESDMVAAWRANAAKLAQSIVPKQPDEGYQLATDTDVRRAVDLGWIRAAVFEQLQALDRSQRDALASTSNDRTVLEVLNSGVPIVRARGQHGIPTMEPMISPQLQAELERQRARASNPDVAAQIDELENFAEATQTIVNVARERAGNLLKRLVEVGPSNYRPSSDASEEEKEVARILHDAGEISVAASGAEAMRRALEPPRTHLVG